MAAKVWQKDYFCKKRNKMKKWLVILAVLLLGTINVFSQEQTKALYDVYLKMGYDAYGNGNYESAINWLTKAAEYAKVNLKDKNYLNLPIQGLAKCYLFVEDYDRAIKSFEYMLPLLANQANKKDEYAAALNNLALCYNQIGSHNQAIQMYKQSLKITKQLYGEKNADYASVLYGLAASSHDAGYYSAAIIYQEQALKIDIEISNISIPYYATALHNLAIYYSDIGNNTRAISLIQKALDIKKMEIGENNLDYVSSLNYLAVLYTNIDDYNSAIRIFKQVITAKELILGKSHSSYASSLEDLAECYSEINDYATAIELHLCALDIRKNTLGESHIDYATSLVNIAQCYKRQGNLIKAHEFHSKLRVIKKSTLEELYPDNVTSIFNIATILWNLQDYDSAIQFQELACQFDKLKTGVNHPNYISSIGNLLILQYYKKEQSYTLLYERWLEHFALLKRYGISQLRNMTSRNRRDFWDSNIIPYIIVHNRLLSKILSNNKKSIRLSYNSLLFSKGVILASDIEFDKVIRESGDTVLLEKFEELRTTRAILNTYYNKPIAERPEGEVERLEARAEVLEKDLLAGSKEYADFTRRLEIEWQDVQAALGDKDVAIEILAADEHIDEDTPPYYAALVLRKGWDAPKFVELCGAEELQTYFDSENGLAMMYREANSRKLYNLIWGKLAEHINEGDNVYFSSGGLLHQVNVELLQDTDGRLANEKYNLHRVSSTRELCFEKPKIANSEAVLYGGLRYDLDSTTMIAQSRAVRPEEEFYAMRGLQLDSLRGKLNYLSASKTEVEKISEQMNQHGIKTTLYVEQVGNEESFKALSGKKTPIIHLATHGFFFKNEEAKVKPFFRMMSMDQERPRPDNSLRRSGLAFAGAQKAWDGEEIPKGIDDGVMLAQEIASMDLAGTDLVVLSACETGLGEINSEGVFGLQRAFKKSGVQTLVMSLWKVHDEATALFMQTFYENLLSGKSKRDSFAAAQMALRKHRDYGKDPYYWAGFIMLD